MRIINFKDLPIRVKILLSSVVSFIGFIILLIFLIQMVEKNMLEIKKETLKNILDINISYLNRLNRDVEEGLLSMEDAKQIGSNYISTFRYGPEGKDYMWINNNKPEMIMHPFRTDLVGKDLSDFSDAKGFKLFLEIVKVCKTGGNGYVTYYWQWKDDKTKIVPKLSYVKEFKPFGWILGTGIYIEDVREEISNLTLMIILTFCIISLISFSIIFYISGRISIKIENVSNNLKEISTGDGNLNVTIEVGSGDEVGSLAGYFNNFVRKIAHVILAINKMSHELASSSREIGTLVDKFSQASQNQAASTEEISSTIEEVSAGMDSIAENSRVQFEIIKELNDKMETLTEIIHKMEQKILETNEKAETISQKARLGGDSINAMNESMYQINKSSEQMKSIINIINDISKKTNLLSLNASIEAARAGEAGRGFAVVADEIAKLAVLTSQSIKNIDELIRSNNEEISKGYNIIQGTVSMIKSITEGITDIHEMMKNLAYSMKNQLSINEEVNRSTENVRNKSNEIKISTEEQKQAISAISNAILNISNHTQSIAEGSQDMNSSYKETNKIAQKLKEQVEFFKT